MKKHSIAILIGCSFGFMILILDGKTAISGIQSGVELCLFTLIPSLFPFCVLSVLMTGAVRNLRSSFLAPLGQLLRIPKGWEILYVLGFLGGYPTGAQNAMIAFRHGHLSKDDASRLAILCNNPGPAFLFGILAPILGRKNVCFLFLSQILSSLALGILLPGKATKQQPFPSGSVIDFTESIRIATVSMSRISGCVVLFRMIIEFLDRWIFWLLPDIWQVVISGFLELSNGCIRLGGISDTDLQMLIASGLLAFGGISVWMQTQSICDGLSIRHYLPWKLLQAGLCVMITSLLISASPLIATLLLLIPVMPFLFRGIGKKEVAF